MNKTYRHLSILFIFSLMLLFGNLAVGKPADTLTMGRATENIAKEFGRILPIVDYLATRLKEDGIAKGKVIIDGENNDRAIITQLNNGNLDLVLESAFSSALYKKNCNAIPILLVELEGMVEYQTYIFSRTDSGINSLDDLVGNVIAFEDPTSTSAHRWPKMQLETMGYRLRSIEGVSPFSKDTIGYLFAGSELNVSSFVFFEKVAAGALSSADWLNPEENPDLFRNTFQIIHQTEALPRMLVMANQAIPLNLLKRIKEELLLMHTTDDGIEALKPFKVNRFLEVPQEALDLIETLSNRIK